MDWDAAARSTMVPFLMPWDGSIPTPRIRSRFSASTRATSVQIFVVPMSIPTTIDSSMAIAPSGDKVRGLFPR